MPTADLPPLRIALVNRFGPPDPAPTGVAAAALAAYLAGRLPGATVTLWTTAERYRSGEVSSPGAGVRVIRRSAGPGHRPGAGRLRRLVAALVASVVLVWRARGADVVITLTDPPFLSLAMGLLRRRSGRWVEWTMDPYPHLFAGLGYLSARNPFYRLAQTLYAYWRPDLMLCLSEGQRRVLAQSGRDGIPALIYPAGVVDPLPYAGEPRFLNPTADAPLRLLYAGNLGKAHAVAGLAALIVRACGRPCLFELAVDGCRGPTLRGLVADQPAVVWRDTQVPLEVLAHADVHLVTLARTAADLSIPAKAITAMCLGRPVVWFGPTECEFWRWLAPAAWALSEQPDGTVRSADVDHVLTALLDPVTRAEKAAGARALGEELRACRDRARAALESWLTA